MTIFEQRPFVVEGFDDKAHCQQAMTSMSEHKGTDAPQYGLVPEPSAGARVLCLPGRWLLLMTI